MEIVNTSHFENIDFYLKKKLRSAINSVKVCVAWINFQDYAPIFNELTSKGVSVEVIFNDDYINRNNSQNLTFNFKYYPARRRYYKSLMHNKFCIIDDKVLITGSFNWSKSAVNHFENIVFVENDFKLIKSYLHEFEDLKSYIFNFYLQSKVQCQQDDWGCRCRSSSYNIGILGSESGLYEESLVSVWNICFNHGHVNFVSDKYENHLSSQLGLNDDSYLDYFHLPYNKEQMLDEFERERQKITNLHNYFGSNQIHAIGCVAIDNEHEHLEYNEEPYYVINVLWRDMYYRKSIPDVIYEADEIISKHQ